MLRAAGAGCCRKGWCVPGSQQTERAHARIPSRRCCSAASQRELRRPHRALERAAVATLRQCPGIAEAPLVSLCLLFFRHPDFDLGGMTVADTRQNGSRHSREGDNESVHHKINTKYCLIGTNKSTMWNLPDRPQKRSAAPLRTPTNSHRTSTQVSPKTFRRTLDSSANFASCQGLLRSSWNPSFLKGGTSISATKGSRE